MCTSRGSELGAALGNKLDSVIGNSAWNRTKDSTRFKTATTNEARYRTRSRNSTDRNEN
jgi:hypothetical protein